MYGDDDFEFEEIDELGTDFPASLRLEGGFDDELGAGASPYDAAIGLRDYLIETNNFGSSNNKVPEIAAFQNEMGMGSDAIGIVGPKTRTKASSLGVTLPQPKSGTVTTTTPKTNTNLVTKTVAELQKLLYGVGWTTKKLADDPRFGPQTVKAWTTSTKTRKVPTTIKRVDATHANVDPVAYARMVADQPATSQQPKTEPKTTIINAPDKKPTTKESAQGLKKYLERTNSFGSSAKPDATVKTYQGLMGMAKKDQIGIVGPITRARAKALGVTLPPKPSVISTVKEVTEQKTFAVDNQKQAALNLKAYLVRYNKFGSDNDKIEEIKNYQIQMGMPKSTIGLGIVGPKTRAKALSLGVTLPPKPAVSKPSEKGHVTVMDPVKIESEKPVVVKNKPETKVSPAKAAEGLRKYLVRTGSFGSLSKPDATVKSYQILMLKIAKDGAVGTETRTRAKALGVTLPPKPTQKAEPIHKAGEGYSKQYAKYKKMYLNGESGVPHYLMENFKNEGLVFGSNKKIDKIDEHIISEHKKERSKAEKSAVAKHKLAIIDRLSDAYPDFKIWDTMKFRRIVIDLLKVAANKV